VGEPRRRLGAGGCLRRRERVATIRVRNLLGVQRDSYAPAGGNARAHGSRVRVAALGGDGGRGESGRGGGGDGGVSLVGCR
jgi:hypothetical protein